MVFYILVVYFCTTLISQVFLLLQIFNTVTLRMPFTRNHYHGTGSAKHSSYSYMTRALRALVCNWMSSCFAKPSSVIMISCKRYIPSRRVLNLSVMSMSNSNSKIIVGGIFSSISSEA